MHRRYTQSNRFVNLYNFRLRLWLPTKNKLDDWLFFQKIIHHFGIGFRIGRIKGHYVSSMYKYLPQSPFAILSWMKTFCHKFRLHVHNMVYHTLHTITKSLNILRTLDRFPYKIWKFQWQSFFYIFILMWVVYVLQLAVQKLNLKKC